MPDMEALAAEFPDTTLRFLANYPTEQGVTSVMEIRTNDPQRFIDDVLGWWPMETIEVLHRDEDTVVVMTEGEPPEGYFVTKDISYHPTSPVVARNGYLFIEFVMPQSKMEELWDALDDRDVTYQVLSITEGYHAVDSITARQREILTTAIEAGYYDSPRTSSVSDIAEQLDVNKSVVSGVLHRAEETIIKDAMGHPEIDAPNIQARE